MSIQLTVLPRVRRTDLAKGKGSGLTGDLSKYFHVAWAQTEDGVGFTRSNRDANDHIQKYDYLGLYFGSIDDEESLAFENYTWSYVGCCGNDDSSSNIPDPSTDDDPSVGPPDPSTGGDPSVGPSDPSTDITPEREYYSGQIEVFHVSDVYGDIWWADFPFEYDANTNEKQYLSRIDEDAEPLNPNEHTSTPLTSLDCRWVLWNGSYTGSYHYDLWEIYDVNISYRWKASSLQGLINILPIGCQPVTRRVQSNGTDRREYDSSYQHTSDFDYGFGSSSDMRQLSVKSVFNRCDYKASIYSPEPHSVNRPSNFTNTYTRINLSNTWFNDSNAYIRISDLQNNQPPAGYRNVAYWILNNHN